MNRLLPLCLAALTLASTSALADTTVAVPTPTPMQSWVLDAVAVETLKDGPHVHTFSGPVFFRETLGSNAEAMVDFTNAQQVALRGPMTLRNDGSVTFSLGLSRQDRTAQATSAAATQYLPAPSWRLQINNAVLSGTASVTALDVPLSVVTSCRDSMPFTYSLQQALDACLRGLTLPLNSVALAVRVTRADDAPNRNVVRRPVDLHQQQKSTSFLSPPDAESTPNSTSR